MTGIATHQTVSSLFVATDGAYFGIPGVEPWDAAKDARNYIGPHPVVAHPPCQLWGSFAAVNHKRWGGEHNRPGNDGGCFASAVKSVRLWGGVLEHPAFSKAWTAYSLGRPVSKAGANGKGMGWSLVGSGPGWRRHWVCEVWQSAYGHRANKRTWLLYVGRRDPFDLRWERPIGTHQCGFHDQRGKARNKPTVSKREASATPPAFRDVLIALARHSRMT